MDRISETYLSIGRAGVARAAISVGLSLMASLGCFPADGEGQTQDGVADIADGIEGEVQDAAGGDDVAQVTPEVDASASDATPEVDASASDVTPEVDAPESDAADDVAAECVPGRTEPCDCDQGMVGTRACDPRTLTWSVCLECVACADGDGDGYASDPRCGLPTDCDDADREVHPGAIEVCDGIDNDCDGTTDADCPCAEGDEQRCGIEEGVCVAGLQRCSGGVWGACEGQVEPSAEVCDGLDNDCDGVTDDGDPGGGDACVVPGAQGPCAVGVKRCVGGEVVCEATVAPGVESCDGVDNDCDGEVDEHDPGEGSACIVTAAHGPCRDGAQRCVDGALRCVSLVEPAPEQCNQVDDDCDGATDEDNAGGGASCVVPGAHGPCSVGTEVCTAAGIVCEQQVFGQPETCNGTDDNCQGEIDEGTGGEACVVAGGQGVCAAGRTECVGGNLRCAQVVQPSAEICDGLDNDCDGASDESDPGGGEACAVVGAHGRCQNGVLRCVDGALLCAQTVQPGIEVCDGAIDEDCDGVIDNGCACTDGSSESCYTGPAGTAGVGLCKSGTRTCTGGNWGPCEGQVLPAVETCDGRDEDCDGKLDGAEGLTRICGSSGVGECSLGSESCSDAGTWTGCTAVEPVPETCDNKDNDCDGTTDQIARECYTGSAATRSVGECRDGTQACTAGVWGACTGQVLPAAETCDNKDNDCDSLVDESLSRSCYSGSSATRNVGTCKDGTQSCSTGTWGTCTGQKLPTTETCNNLDDDCDGATDEVAWPSPQHELNDDPVGANYRGGVSSDSTVSVSSSFHHADDEDYFYWSRTSTTSGYWWMCRISGLAPNTVGLLWIGIDQCGSPYTWEWGQSIKPFTTPGDTLVSRYIPPHQHCPAYRLAVGVLGVNPISSCNASYTIECRLDSNGVW